MPIPAELQQAAENLQAENKVAARALLSAYLRQHPNDDNAWLMMSQAVDSSQQQADCLRQVLRINPQHKAAQRLLDRLGVAPAAPAAPRPTAPAERTSGLAPWQSQRSSYQPPAIPTAGPEAYQSAHQPPDASQPAARFEPWQSQYTPYQPPAIPQANFEPEPHSSSCRSPDIPQAAPVSVNPSPASLSGAAASPKTGLSRNKRLALIASGVLTGLLVLGAAILILPALVGSGAAQPSLSQANTDNPPAAQGTPGSTARVGISLPPTWTPTGTATATLPPTPTATPSPTISPTPLPPPPTVLAVMDRIQKEVSDMRGLTIKAHPPRYLISRIAIEQQIRAALEAEDAFKELQDQARYLSALTLIKPTYDAVRYAMNGMMDGIGGFYEPDKKDIYVLEIKFGGAEHLTYAHEFDHALVDQHFDIAAMQEQSFCKTDNDRCTALRALIEGDATLLMYQWFKQYATPQDYRDIARYNPPLQALPEQFPPEYVREELRFPYDQGMVFVKRFYEQGNWKRVNQLYTNPPTSTEQIIHPEKYDHNEQPIPVQDPDIQAAVGKPWRTIGNNTLGELRTMLLLSFTSDEPSRRSPAEARKAAAGWGGDHVQVLYQDATEQTITAIHWVWDTRNDASEFEASIKAFMNEYSRGGKAADRNCWEATQQYICLYARSNDTLLIMAPDQPLLELVKGAYPWH